MNKTDYLSKSLAFLGSKQFEKVDSDPTGSFQSRVQRCLLRMKKAFDKKTYNRLYPSSSRPGLFFGLAKVHKLKDGSDNVNELPLRPVISNIGTATYQVSKYLADILLPLTKNEYTINNTKDFVDRLRSATIAPDCIMVSFDVESLFTNVPLDYTINYILDKVYKDKVIKTKLKRNQLQQLLQLCTKEMHFSFGGQIFRQVDGVAMGSPLGPVLANIFMVSLENSLVNKLSDKMPLWFRYVDDTFTFIKKGEIEHVIEILNKFHKDINFTHEVESDNIISFLDVKVIRQESGTFVTEVYRKATDTNIYINWKSFAPKAWKIGTLGGLFRRAHIICSCKEGLDKEIKHLKFVFTKINGYPNKLVHSTLHKVVKKLEQQRVVQQPLVQETNVTVQAQPIVHPHICLPYKGEPGDQVLKKFKNWLGKCLPSNVKPRFAYRGKHVSSLFPVKDRIKWEHQSNLVYGYASNEELQSSSQYEYIGQTNVRLETRTHQHARTDVKSSVYKNAREKNLTVEDTDFVILATGYQKLIDRRIAESLYIKQYQPTLNPQADSYKLKLFN